MSFFFTLFVFRNSESITSHIEWNVGMSVCAAQYQNLVTFKLSLIGFHIFHPRHESGFQRLLQGILCRVLILSKIFANTFALCLQRTSKQNLNLMRSMSCLTIQACCQPATSRTKLILFQSKSDSAAFMTVARSESKCLGSATHTIYYKIECKNNLKH